MSIDRIFYAFIVAVGVVAGAVLVIWPGSASFPVKPYFWILFAMAGFEAVAFAIGRGAPGTMLTNLTRLIGLALGIILMMAIAWLAGVEVQFL
jgi:hypothetical protein